MIVAFGFILIGVVGLYGLGIFEEPNGQVININIIMEDED